jgi:hypothetical protein
MIIQQKCFLKREGTSDKVYYIWIELDEKSNSYSVPFRFGRRNWGFNKLNIGKKVSVATLKEATKQFNKIIREKERKGYIPFDTPEELEVYNALAY